MGASTATHAPLNHRHPSGWQVSAKAAIEEYLDEIDELGAQSGDVESKALALAGNRLEEARGLWARTGGRLVEYWTGSIRQETWLAIHEADVVLTYARPAEHIRAELPGLRQMVRRRVDDAVYREDLLERLKSIEGALDEQANSARKTGNNGSRNGGSSGTALTLMQADREAVAHAKQEVYEISAKGYESQRSFRNIILVTAVIAALVAAALAIFGLFDDTITYRLDMYPNTGSKTWPETIWPIELVGALAGFIVAITALRRLPGRGPYSLRVAQAGLKVPVGALTALTGMLLLQSSAFGIGPVKTKGEFVAWAFVFGASQELVTRLVDQKAATVAEKARPGG